VAGCTLAVYAQVRTHEFDNFDTPVYVSNNGVVHEGLTLHGVGWAFTTFTTANWHPLTWRALLRAQQLDPDLRGLQDRLLRLRRAVRASTSSPRPRRGRGRRGAAAAKRGRLTRLTPKSHPEFTEPRRAAVSEIRNVYLRAPPSTATSRAGLGRAMRRG